MVVGFTVLLTVVSYPVFVVGVSLIGIGAGLYFVPMRALLADLFVERRGKALGVNLAAGMAGSVLAAGLAIGVLEVATWETAFLPIVAVLVLVLLALVQWGREPYCVGWVDLDLRATVRRVFGARRIRHLVIAYSLWAFTFQAVANFLPTFLQTNGLSPELATMGFALLFLVASVVMPIAGDIGDRVGHVAVASGGIVIGAIGLVGILVAPNTPTVFAAIIIFAAGLMAYPPVMQAYLMETFPAGDIGGDFGAFKTVYTALGSLGPVYAGVVAEWAGFTIAFGGGVGCLLIGAGLTLLVLKQNR
jgi:MFS family permease